MTYQICSNPTPILNLVSIVRGNWQPISGMTCKSMVKDSKSMLPIIESFKTSPQGLLRSYSYDFTRVVEWKDVELSVILSDFTRVVEELVFNSLDAGSTKGMPPDFLVIFAAMALLDSFCLSFNTDLSLTFSVSLWKLTVGKMNKAKAQKGNNEATESW